MTNEIKAFILKAYVITLEKGIYIIYRYFAECQVLLNFTSFEKHSIVRMLNYSTAAFL